MKEVVWQSRGKPQECAFMSLMGKAALTMWHNLKPDTESDHDHWHSSEHLFERISIPGFNRGRRYKCADAESAFEKYFILYEVDDLSVLTSEDYLKRLNNPTPWSQKIIPNICDMTRTVCRTLTSKGGGIGTALGTLRFTAPPEIKTAAIRHLNEEVLPALTRARGVVGVHLLEGDVAASGLDTEEKRLRETPDSTADLILLIEAYDETAIHEAMNAASDMPISTTSGNVSVKSGGVCRLQHAVAKPDLAA